MLKFLNPPILKHLKQITIITLLLLPFSYYVHIIISHAYSNSDFRPFYSSAKILQLEPQKLYQIETQREYQFNYVYQGQIDKDSKMLLFVNPPFFLLLYLPFSIFPITTGYYLMVCFLTILLLLTLYILSKIFPQPKPLISLLLALSFAPTYSTISYTQSSLITLLIYIAVYYLLKQKSLFLAGLTSSILLYKPQLGIFLWLYLLLQKCKPVYFGYFLGISLFSILSFMLVKENLSLIPDLLHLFLNPQFGIGTTNRISWMGFTSQLNSLWPHINIQTWGYALSILTFLIGFKTLNKIKYNSPNLPQAFNIIILITLLCGIHIIFYEAILLLFPFYYYRSTHPQSNLIQKFILLGWLLSFSMSFGIKNIEPSYFFPIIYLAASLYLIIKHIKHAN